MEQRVRLITLEQLKNVVKDIKKNRGHYLNKAILMDSKRGKYGAFFPVVMSVDREEYMNNLKDMSETTRQIVASEYDLIFNGIVTDLAEKTLYKNDEELLEKYRTADTEPLAGAVGSKNNVCYINFGCITLIQRVDYIEEGFVLNCFFRSTDMPTAGYTDALVIGEIGFKIEDLIGEKFIGSNIMYSLPHFYEGKGVARRK